MCQTIFKRALVAGAMLTAATLFAPAQAADRAFPDAYIEALRSLRTMAAFDGNADHKVTRKEFMEMQEKMFDAMDRNKNGVLDEQEWMERIFYSRG